MPLLLILIPLAGLIVLNLPLGSFVKTLSFYFALLMLLAQALLVLFPVPGFWTPGMVSIAPFINVTLAIDPFTTIMLFSISVVAIAALFLGWFAKEELHKRSDFTSLLMICVMGMNGVVMVNDLFSLYVFLEIVAVCSFVLIAFHKNRDGLEGSFKYLVMSAVATAMMLAAIALIAMIAGGTSFAAAAAMFKEANHNFLALTALGLFIAGLAIKGGLVPFHGWLPDAYSSAPSSVSVLLAGIVTKTTGVYTVIRLVSAVFGFTPAVSAILLMTGAITIVFGALSALGQKDFKRMLAYSSISQVGYIILSLGTGTPLGIAGAVFHLFNHAIFKSQLFINAAAVEEQAGTRDMDRLGGLSERMPITGSTSVIGMLSTVGIPPLSGFWSKIIIIIALWQSGHFVFAAVAVLASVLTLAYFLSMQRRVFFGKVREGLENLQEAPASFVVPALVLALITIGVGIFFPYVMTTFILPVQSILG